jgi:hypothetical protein
MMNPTTTVNNYQNRLKSIIDDDELFSMIGLPLDLNDESSAISAKLINSLSVRCSKTSIFHDDTIVCDNKLKNYSFVRMRCGTFGRVCSITQLKYYRNNNVARTKYFVDLLLMEIDNAHERTDYFHLTKLKWRDDLEVRMFDIVNLDDILWVDPDMSTETSIQDCMLIDRFWMRTRSFYERTGYTVDIIDDELCPAVIPAGESIKSANSFVSEYMAVESNRSAVDFGNEADATFREEFIIPDNSKNLVESLLAGCIYN